MKIIVYGIRGEHEEHLSYYVMNQMDGSEYGQGALENLEKTTWKIQEVIGNLVDVLADKGLLDGEDVGRVLGKLSGVTLKKEDPDEHNN